MKSKFIKNNIGLVVVVSICLVVAVLELGFISAQSLQFYKYSKRVKDLGKKIRKITNERPVANEDNRKPIEEDIAVYKKACDELYKQFGRPLTPAVEAFFETLRIRKSMWIKDLGGVEENDDVVRQIFELSRGAQPEAISNRDFDRYLDVISARKLAKQVKELSADDEKTKQIKEWIPDLEKLKENALADRILKSAELSKRLPGVLLDAETLAKKIKALPADGEQIKPYQELISDLDKTELPDLKERIAGDAALNKKLQTLLAIPELAERLSKMPAADPVAKEFATLIPEWQKSDAAARGKLAFDLVNLDRNLREMFPDTDSGAIENLRKIPEHFKPEEFIEKNRQLFEVRREEPGAYDNRTRRLNAFRSKRFENWDEARAAFIRAIGQGEDKSVKLRMIEKFDITKTYEATNVDAVVFSVLGVPRDLDGQPKKLNELLQNIRNQLRALDVRLDESGRANGLGIVYTESGPEGGFAGGEGVSNINNINPDDYPAIADHLDIISYMLYRLSGVNARAAEDNKLNILDVQIRARSGDGEGSSVKRFNESKEQRDGFDIYHYTIEVEGTQAQILAAMTLLDNCYDVKRVYVVRNIAFYAQTNSKVYALFVGDAEEQEEEQKNQNAGGGSRHRYADLSPDSPGEAVENEQKLDPKEVARLREEEKKLPLDRRPGYGDPITTENERIRAVIDVEYVVKPGL